MSRKAQRNSCAGFESPDRNFRGWRRRRLPERWGAAPSARRRRDDAIRVREKPGVEDIPCAAASDGRGVPDRSPPRRTAAGNLGAPVLARLPRRRPHRASITTMATSSVAGDAPRKARTSSSVALISASGDSARWRLKAPHRRSSPKNSPWRFCVSVIPSV